MERKVTVPDLQRMKEAGTKITALTAYDFPFAQIVDQAGIDVIRETESARRLELHEAVHR